MWFGEDINSAYDARSPGPCKDPQQTISICLTSTAAGRH
jgi:hypothetical protein